MVPLTPTGPTEYDLSSQAPLTTAAGVPNVQYPAPVSRTSTPSKFSYANEWCQSEGLIDFMKKSTRYDGDGVLNLDNVISGLDSPPSNSDDKGDSFYSKPEMSGHTIPHIYYDTTGIEFTPGHSSYVDPNAPVKMIWKRENQPKKTQIIKCVFELLLPILVFTCFWDVIETPVFLVAANNWNNICLIFLITMDTKYGQHICFERPWSQGSLSRCLHFYPKKVTEVRRNIGVLRRFYRRFLHLAYFLYLFEVNSKVLTSVVLIEKVLLSWDKHWKYQAERCVKRIQKKE